MKEVLLERPDQLREKNKSKSNIRREVVQEKEEGQEASRPREGLEPDAHKPQP